MTSNTRVCSRHFESGMVTVSASHPIQYQRCFTGISTRKVRDLGFGNEAAARPDEAVNNHGTAVIQETTEVYQEVPMVEDHGYAAALPW